jgi:hypothetical protein
MEYDGDFVPPRPDDSTPGFITVFLGKQWGFVQEDRTRALGDWYFEATKRAGRWLLTTILAG